jgi:HD-like signal output (HDOD) protein
MESTVNSAPKEFEGRLAQGKDWREIVAWVGDLPPMPTVAGRAISLIENPDCTASELTKILSTDAALAARVLKIANSAMFARQREITTLSQAVMVIGFKSLKGVIVAATLRQFQKKFGPTEKLIWEGSMCSGMAAAAIAKQLKKKYAEEVFLLGLLHNLGQIVLLFQPNTALDYKKVFESIKESGGDYNTVEQELLGFSHPLIGALVAKKWNFSSDTCQVILHYADPLDQLRTDNETEEKTLIVRLADEITHAAGIGIPEGYSVYKEQLIKIAQILGFPNDNLETTIDNLIQETKIVFEKERHIYD